MRVPEVIPQRIPFCDSPITRSESAGVLKAIKVDTHITAKYTGVRAPDGSLCLLKNKSRERERERERERVYIHAYIHVETCHIILERSCMM